MIVRGNRPGQRRNRELNGGAPRGWNRVRPERLYAGPSPPRPVRLFAIVSTWFDADIIAATVRNCFDQGCERVYLLDNASPDDTALQAKAAGAVIKQVYATEYYDDDYRCQLQNDIAREIVLGEEPGEIWILSIDADELPIGYDGRRLVDCLAELPRPVRVVGSSFIDLYPTSSDQYEPGRHPAACMSGCMLRHGAPYMRGRCEHWKHQLVKYDGKNFDVAMIRGNHAPMVPRGRLFEAQWTMPVFHAPYRREADTRARCEALCRTGRNKWDDDVTNGNGAVRRWRSIDALYSGRFNEVEIAHTQVYGRAIVGLALYDWRKLFPELVNAISKPCELTA